MRIHPYNPKQLRPLDRIEERELFCSDYWLGGVGWLTDWWLRVAWEPGVMRSRESCVVMCTWKPVNWRWVARPRGRVTSLHGDSIFRWQWRWTGRWGRMRIEAANKALLHWSYLLNRAITSSVCSIIL